MSAKNILLDFLNYLFIIILVLLCILYFIDPLRFEAFTELMHAIIPLAVFAIIFLIKVKFLRQQFESKKEEGSTDIIIYLDYTDKVKAELIIFGIPMLIILVKLMIAGAVDLADILVAAIAYALLIYWHRYLFNKART